MFYLFANVLFASAFTLCIKWAQVRRREDVVTIGAINYMVAAILILPQFLGNEVAEVSTSAVWTGSVMGACYFIAFFFVTLAIRSIGVSSTTVVAVLSILVPIAFGIMLWDEQPNGYQIAGIGLAMISLALIGRTPATGDDQTSPDERSSTRPWLIPLILVSFFLLAGLSRLAQEAFKHVSSPDQRLTFLWSAFLVAAIPSLVLLVVRRRRVLPIELAFGFLMGASNILQTHFILKALQQFDGFIVFPVVSAGSLMLTTMVATRMLGERLNRRSLVGIVTAVIALVLLNYLPE